MILIIEENHILAECVGRATKTQYQICPDPFFAIQQIDQLKPELIFLGVMLPALDAFTFLHEIASYSETAQIPIVLLTSEPLQTYSLEDYGIVGILDTTTMTPTDISHYVTAHTSEPAYAH